jgi:RimJ/RimL family protein N-acetyltransferase
VAGIPLRGRGDAVIEATYPKDLAHDVRLPSGARIHIRPIRPEDESRLLALFNRLSMTTRYQRFFSALKRLPADGLRHFANVDYCERLALVAERATDGRLELVGVARYEPTDGPDTREIAIVVEDHWHGQGLGTILLKELLQAAGVRGIHRFRAFVLADNQRMLRVLERVGTVVETATEEGVVEVLLTTPRSA